jgi:hypothetical protein
LAFNLISAVSSVALHCRILRRMSSPVPDPAPSPNDPPLARVRPVLSYATPGATLGRMVTVARCANGAEAELYAGALADAGIPAHVLNRNTNALGAYVGAADVEVQVLESDAGRARDLLNAVQNPDELEPADEADDPPPADDEGRPLALAVVAAYDHAGAMRDAATILAAANVRAYTPRLVPRGDRPPGQGKRFVLRVQEDDADRARSVLEAAAEEDAAEGGAEDEPRCPKCRSWRVYPIGGGVLQAIGKLFGRPAVPEGFECLACGHRGEKAKFLARRG